MAFNFTGLVAAIGTAERLAIDAVNGLNKDSGAEDLTKANFAMAQYQMISTAVSALIKAEQEAKAAPARMST